MANNSLLLMIVAVFLLQASATCGAPADRFKGGAYDGWSLGLLASDPIWPGYSYPFKGGAYDGYASARVSGRVMWGTLISVH